MRHLAPKGWCIQVYSVYLSDTGVGVSHSFSRRPSVALRIIWAEWKTYGFLMFPPWEGWARYYRWYLQYENISYRAQPCTLMGHAYLPSAIAERLVCWAKAEIPGEFFARVKDGAGVSG